MRKKVRPDLFNAVPGIVATGIFLATVFSACSGDKEKKGDGSHSVVADTANVADTKTATARPTPDGVVRIKGVIPYDYADGRINAFRGAAGERTKLIVYSADEVTDFIDSNLIKFTKKIRFEGDDSLKLVWKLAFCPIYITVKDENDRDDYGVSVALMPVIIDTSEHDFRNAVYDYYQCKNAGINEPEKQRIFNYYEKLKIAVRVGDPNRTFIFDEGNLWP